MNTTPPAGTMPPPPPRRRGLIGLFVRHHTAANLLMIGMVLVGVYAASRMNTQFFPDIEIPVINVTVTWTGASAEDVEANILDALEPELRFLDGVEKIVSYAREGLATISMEFAPNADMQKAQSDVEQAVGRVTTLPEAAEQPEITRVPFYDRVAKVVVSGPYPEKTIKIFAKQIRDGLLAAGIDRVTFTGSRSEEISVRIPEGQLRRLNLSIADVAQRIRDNTRDLPAGRLEGPSEKQLRSLSERKTPEAIGTIEVRALGSGEKVRLRDIADIQHRFDRDDYTVLLNGNPAIELLVQRSFSADTLITMRLMQRYLTQIREQLPQNLTVKTYDVRGKLVVGRLGILVANGLQGLILVLLVLFLLLNMETAFWVALGIPAALLAALGVMYASGQSINMVSMFGLIMMLGIVVDDAIVVGEDVATRIQNGLPRAEAAEQGAYRMLGPVSASTLTTQASFLPIFVIGDRIGDIMSALPLVVLAVLFASLLECFLILPAHLRHGLGAWTKPGRYRLAFDAGFARFRDGPFRRFVELTYTWRYVTVSVMVAGLIIAFGLVVGGRIGFHFFPSLESENLTAVIEFSAGTPKADQKAAVVRIEDALRRAERQLLQQARARAGEMTPPTPAAEAGKSADAKTSPPDDLNAQRKVDDDPLGETLTDIVKKSFTNIFRRGEKQIESRLVEISLATLGKSGRSRGDNLAEISVQLTPSEVRTIRTRAIVRAWYRNLPKIPGLERVAIVSRRPGPPGRDIDIRLQRAPAETLKRAAEELKEALSGYPGVTAIADNLPYGKPELIMELTDRGTALGFTGASVGNQVRNAFDGAIATRFARGDEEITVRVQRTQPIGGHSALSDLHLISPTGQRVPLSEVVRLREKVGFSIVQRREGIRTIAVTGDIDQKVTSVAEITASLARDVMPAIVQKYGLSYEFKGRDEERQTAFKDLQTGALLALAMIYIVLAWVFGSYWRPFAVLIIVPFGIMGAIYGHYVMGMALSIISLIGILGLSGILVNDSIVLVDQIRRRQEMGDTLDQAAIGASTDRLRAVMLTSLTTIFGLMPLLFETSRQAQFLIPMAITIVFGLAATTILVLILEPALIGIGGDISRTLRGLRTLVFGRPRTSAPAE